MHCSHSDHSWTLPAEPLQIQFHPLGLAGWWRDPGYSQQRVASSSYTEERSASLHERQTLHSVYQYKVSIYGSSPADPIILMRACELLLGYQTDIKSSHSRLDENQRPRRPWRDLQRDRNKQKKLRVGFTPRCTSCSNVTDTDPTHNVRSANRFL